MKVTFCNFNKLAKFHDVNPHTYQVKTLIQNFKFVIYMALKLDVVIALRWNEYLQNLQNDMFNNIPGGFCFGTRYKISQQFS